MTTTALSEVLAEIRKTINTWRDVENDSRDLSAPFREAHGSCADKLEELSDRIESALASAEPLAGLSLRFGLGAWVVNTGAHDGEPCVFIDDAPKPGKVGERAEPVREGTTPRLRILFPTDDQCVRVADALVNAPLSPSAAHMRDLADMLDPEKQADVLRAAADALPAAKVEAHGDGLRDYPYLIGLAKVLRMRGDPENANALDSVAERIRRTAPTPASVPDGFYLASFKHKDRGDAMMWWGPDNAGYTTDIEQAGIYTEIAPGYHDSDHTVPVPVSFLDGCRIRRTLDPDDSKNRAFWSAADLRAAIATKSEYTQ